MRTKSTIKNISGSIAASIVSVAMGLVAQKIFIETLGLEYLGINGLFTNIVSMLGIVELGLSSAVIYHLYKPIAVGNKKLIKSLIQFYKIGYRLIAGIVALIGLSIMPFLPYIVGDVTIQINIYTVYLLFLADVVFSYLLAYRRSILLADQKNYLISTIHIGYTIVVNILQIAILLLTMNFYFYLIAKIVMRIAENILVNTIVNRRYTFLKDRNVTPIDKATRGDIFQKLRGIFMHKIGEFAIFGSDNVIISLFLGVKTVGLFSNYALIITSLTSIIWQMFSAMTSSVGNLLVTSNPTKSFETFSRVRFANFWIATVVAISLLTCMDSFIEFWLGRAFILPLDVLVALSINLYLQLSRSVTESFKDAAGIFHQDRYIPILESIINVAFSILFLHFFGLVGVIMGTICSNLLLHLYSYPKYVYTQLFGRTYGEYYREFGSSLFLVLFIAAITFAVSHIISVANPFLQLGLEIITALIVSNGLLYATFHRNKEFRYYLDLLRQVFRTVQRRTQVRIQK